jgi:glycosyltransferase involved in cell wall biosynthesis
MRVLHFYNWGYFAPISSGADVIAANQLEYLHSKGWEVDCLLVSEPKRSHQAEAFRERYSWVRSVQLVDPPQGEWSFRDQITWYSRIARSESFRRLARQGHDLFLTNYVFTSPLVEQLPRGCLRLLEAVDFITDSFALNERITSPRRDALAPARDTFLRKVEMELYRLFDGVLFINEQEYNLVEPHHPGQTHFIPTMMPWEIRPEPPDPAVDSRATLPEQPFDLIFVGSSAEANVCGLTAFYRKVYVPYLRKHRIRLAVIGSVCERLEFDDWYVTKLGVVKGSVEEYYAHSKVVIIPILDGSGLSIKTVESLALGRAVVTTAVGTRGLTHDPEAYAQIDIGCDPAGAASAILELLASDSLRKRMQCAAQQYYRTHFGRDRYFHAMDRVMSSLGLCA